MAILNWLIGKRSLTIDQLDQLMDRSFGGSPSVTGMWVTPDSSLSTVAVFASVRILAETIAMLPLVTYRRLAGGGKERAQDHRLYHILHDAGNPEMTSYELRECLVGHLALWGNAYAEIEMSDNGPLALWPLRPDRMRVTRTPAGLLYNYTLPNRTTPVPLPAARILHLRGLSSDGIMGYSPIAMAREAVGLAMATEQYAARWFGNDARPGGVLQHPGKLSQGAQDRIKQSWEESHRGLSNSSRVAVLEEGVTWQSVGLPPEDSQFIQSRRFQVEEIARLFRIPPHLLADLERATFSNIEQMSLEFVMYTLMPWLVSIEQRILQSLFQPGERDTYFAEHLVTGLLRGDTASRYQAYQTGRLNGWLNADDIREMENMNPLPDGEGQDYWMPANMLVAGRPPPPAAPPAGPTPTEETPPEGEAGARTLALPEGETRSNDAARRQLSASYMPIFTDFATRIVRRERADVLRAAEKHLLRRDAKSFTDWLDTYYKDMAPAYMETMMRPAMTSYGSLIAASAASQIGFKGLKTPDLERFTTDYVRSAVGGHALSSRNQLLRVLQQSVEEDTDALDAVSTRLDEWADKGPDKMSRMQTVQARGAFCAFAWRSGGVKRLVWHTSGGKNCPFCTQMDGRTAGIDESFVGEGDTLDGGDGQGMTPSRNISHEPLHEGCVCSVGPE